MRLSFFLIFLQCSFLAVAQDVDIKLIDPKTDASFRGLSVVDDNIAWASGSKGWIGKTENGGKDWNYQQVPGFEKFDFRAVYAFDSKKAVIANAGAPANILFTDNGGATWKTVYTNNDTSAFIDGVDFFNDKEGIIYGDPMNGKMLLLKTSDGGLTWKEFPEASRPSLATGEASFAASGTNIRCVSKNEVIIATGGAVSQLWTSSDKGASWNQMKTPILQGEAATGIFSFACKKPDKLIIVGGNYLNDSLRNKHVYYSNDYGKNWIAPEAPTRGYRECVEYISKNTLITAGPSGIDISHDDGKNWKPLSDEKYFHVVRKARNGNLVLVAGGKGKIAIVKRKS